MDKPITLFLYPWFMYFYVFDTFIGPAQGRNRGWLPEGAQPNFLPVSVEELG